MPAAYGLVNYMSQQGFVLLRPVHATTPPAMQAASTACNVSGAGAAFMFGRRASLWQQPLVVVRMGHSWTQWLCLWRDLLLCYFVQW
jgi:hypothetical protein